MTRMTLQAGVAGLIVTVLWAGLWILPGCGSDSPVAPEPTTGTVIVETAPDSIAAPWSLSLPGGELVEGVSDSVFSNAPAGDYVLVWGDYIGWRTPTPNPMRKNLSGGSEIIFSVIYAEDSETRGTIDIDPGAHVPSAAWSLSGPHGFQFAGTGSARLRDLVIGDYVLTWRPVPGWATPFASRGTLGVGETMVLSTEYLTFSAMALVTVPPPPAAMPALFTMGSLEFEDETPHEVTLTRSFTWTDSEVTNGQYVELLQWAFDQGHVAATPSSARTVMDGGDADLFDLDGVGFSVTFSDGVFATSDPDAPMGELTWYGAAAFCDWLSMREGLPRAYNHATWVCNGGDPYGATGYRLPTEAEWEFACRNGMTDIPDDFFEWCQDWYGDYGGNETDPTGATTGTNRVVRLYSRLAGDLYSGCARRPHNFPFSTFSRNGFRPARTID